MPAYTIQYFHHSEKVFEETVFMQNILAVKVSATHQAPQHIIDIKVFDLMGHCIADRKQGQWQKIK